MTGIPDTLSRREVLRLTSGTTAFVGLAGVSGLATGQRSKCPKSLGYWKTHPDQWPQTSAEGSALWFCSRWHTKADLIELLERPPKGNTALLLVKQLIAAKLNTWNGASSCITLSDRTWPVLDECAVATEGNSVDNYRLELVCSAQRWLEASGFCENKKVGSWTVSVDQDDGSVSIDGEALKDALDAYNNGEFCDGCDGGEQKDRQGDEKDGHRDTEPSKRHQDAEDKEREDEKDDKPGRRKSKKEENPGRGNKKKKDKKKPDRRENKEKKPGRDKKKTKPGRRRGRRGDDDRDDDDEDEYEDEDEERDDGEGNEDYEDERDD